MHETLSLESLLSLIKLDMNQIKMLAHIAVFSISKKF